MNKLLEMVASLVNGLGTGCYNKRGLEIHPHQERGDKRARQLEVSRKGTRFVSTPNGTARVVRKHPKGVRAFRSATPGITRKGRRVLPYVEDHARRLFKKARLAAKKTRRIAYRAKKMEAATV